MSKTKKATDSKISVMTTMAAMKDPLQFLQTLQMLGVKDVVSLDGTVNTIIGSQLSKGLSSISDATIVDKINKAGLMASMSGDKDGGMDVQKMMMMQSLGGSGDIDPMMLMLMGGGDIDPMMLMMMNKDGGDIDPMMLMMMNQGKDGGKGGMDMQQMLLMQSLNGSGDIDPMMLMMMGGGDIDPMTLMMMGGGDIDPMMLMLMNKDGGKGGIDPMMLMLMNKDGGDIDPIMLMMMGGGDIDPMMFMLMNQNKKATPKKSNVSSKPNKTTKKAAEAGNNPYSEELS